MIELGRPGVRVVQPADTFGMAEATIYNWLKQDRIDDGEEEGLATDSAARARGREESDQAAGDPGSRSARKVNEVFLDQDLAPEASSR